MRMLLENLVHATLELLSRHFRVQPSEQTQCFGLLMGFDQTDGKGFHGKGSLKDAIRLR